MRVHKKEKEMDLNSAKKQLDCERMAHNETRLRWEGCHDQLEEEQRQRSIEQKRVSAIFRNISVVLSYLMNNLFFFKSPY